MNRNNLNRIIESTPKKDTVNTVLKVLSAVLLVMNIIKLGKELTKKDEKKKNLPYK
ncbi:hypothetical protein [Aquimarina latercula]|uniref:hypothetical protein n=1 Tax=Aquimarina latercula TaxID=987 RepID=UPI00041880A1|nr:hypothetical protein [Aquimarina latercula]